MPKWEVLSHDYSSINFISYIFKVDKFRESMSARLLLPIESFETGERRGYFIPNSELIIEHRGGLNILREESKEMKMGYGPAEAHRDAPEWANAIMTNGDRRIHFLQLESVIVDRFVAHIDNFWRDYLRGTEQPRINPDYDGAGLVCS